MSAAMSGSAAEISECIETNTVDERDAAIGRFVRQMTPTSIVCWCSCASWPSAAPWSCSPRSA